MTSAPTVKINELFNKVHVPPIHFESQSPLVRILDNRVSDIALRVLAKVSAGIGLGAAFAASLISGVGSIPFIFVGSCLVVNCICHFIASKLNMLFNSDKLRQHQAKAEAFILSHKYLSEVACFKKDEDKIIKSKFIIPLTTLIEKYTASDLIAYKILSEELLVKAFLIEVEHKDFSESLALYNTISRAIGKKGANNYSNVLAKVKPKLEEKANVIIESIRALIADQEVNTFSEFYKLSDELAIKFEQIKNGINAGVIADTNNLDGKLQQWFKEVKELISSKSSKSLRPIKKILAKKEKAINFFEKMYKGNELHEVVEAKQKEFIASLELIYTNKKQRDEKILEDFNSNYDPIDVRNAGKDLSEEDQDLKKAFEGIRDKRLEQSLDLAQTEMETLAERFASDDLIKTNQNLLQYYNEMEAKKTRYLKQLDHDIATFTDLDHSFKVNYTKKLETFRKLTQGIKDHLA